MTVFSTSYRRQLTPVLALMLISLNIGSVQAHNPVDYLEVFAAKAGAPVEHDVELACEGLFERRTLDLAGPTHFSASVGCSGKPAPKSGVFIHWYAIAGTPDQADSQKVKTLDFLRNSKNLSLEIDTTPKFFLSATQLLSSGEPAPAPEGLDHYLAFAVKDAPSLEKEVAITGGLNASQKKRELGKPRYICLPAHEWHHDEEFPVSHRLTCFVAYEMDKENGSKASKASTLDQFGLNQLTLEASSELLLVRGAILK